jgi:hypothetical protein
MTVRLELKDCPRCGGPIPVESPQGLCPKCLMRQAAAPTEAGERDATSSAPPGHEELAAAFPQLEILELVGQGGMGFVFKARQPNLDRFVALKILPRSLAADPAFAARFTREGRVLARLNHPNIVTIHDFGQANGFFYLLIEFVDGVNLRQAMKTGRFTPSQALTIVPKICEALQFAHSEGGPAPRHQAGEYSARFEGPVAIHRLRRRFREVIKNEIGQTVSEPAQVEQELHYLLEALL